MYRKTLMLSAALVVGAQCFAGPASFAQDAPAVDTQDTIIVTARKRNEDLNDVPVAVTALNEDEIKRYETNSLTVLSQQAPQLVIGESTNQVGGSINLRGIGAGTSNPSTEQAVSINVDGVPISYGNAVRLGQYDLQQVEVLKGPQALFFGKNSPAGIISLVSKGPGDEFEAKLRGGYEFEAKQKFAEAVISGPLTETLGARVVAYYSKEDGYFENIGQAVPGRTPGRFADSLNSEDVFARGTLAYNSLDGLMDLTARVSFVQKKRDGVGPAGFGQPVFCPFGSSQVSGGLTTDCTLDKFFSDVGIRPEAAALDPSLNGGEPFTTSKQFLTSLTGNFHLSDALTFTSVTGYYEVTEDSFDSFTMVTIPAVSASNDIDITAFTQEFRLSSDYDSPVNFMVGAFIQDGEFTIDQTVPIDLGGTPFITPNTFFDQDTNAMSVFAQVIWDVTDQLELAAGGRYSYEEKSLSATMNNAAATILNPSQDYDDFSPEVTLAYKPLPDLTFYAAYREGFTSGGFNTAPTTLQSTATPTGAVRDLSFEQMNAAGGELGVKGFLGGRQVRFDLTGYYFEYEDLQLSRFDTVAVSQTTQNAGAAEVQGVEFSTVVKPDVLPDLELRGSVAYNDASYSDFVGGCFPGQSIAAGCNLTPRDATADPSTFGTAGNPYTEQDQTGQQIARAPEWAANVGFSYDLDFGSALAGSLSFDASYSSSYLTQIEGQPESEQEGYWQINSAFSLFGGVSQGWKVDLIGRNLTNEIFRVSGGALAFTGSGTGTASPTPADIFGSVSAPRSVMLQLTLNTSMLGRY